jgi:hypothetical protein
MMPFGRHVSRALLHGAPRSYFWREEHSSIYTLADVAAFPTRTRPLRQTGPSRTSSAEICRNRLPASRIYDRTPERLSNGFRHPVRIDSGEGNGCDFVVSEARKSELQYLIIQGKRQILVRLQKLDRFHPYILRQLQPYSLRAQLVS